MRRDKKHCVNCIHSEEKNESSVICTFWDWLWGIMDMPKKDKTIFHEQLTMEALDISCKKFENCWKKSYKPLDK
jgi:hypothetical protein